MSLRLKLAVYAALLTAPLAIACGPDFERSILARDDAEMLRLPAARFVQEIAKLKAADTPFKHIPTAGAERDANLEAELADLRAALAGDHIPPERLAGAQAAIKAARDDTRPIAERLAGLPPTLPAEFHLYTTGRLTAGDAGLEQLKQLLSLPPEQRRYRSTWAAYMIGRRLVETSPARSIEWFRRVRELAGAGYHDTLGLAAASYGREAQAELALEHFDRAIDLYLQQLASGDTSAVRSLQLTAEKALQSDAAALAKLAAHPAGRRVLTVFAAADGGPWIASPASERIVAWITAVEAASVPAVDYAEQLAWAAYYHGQYRMAQRWVDRAPPDDPQAQWIRAKLLLRDGHIDAAMQKLAAAIKHLPTDDGTPRGTDAGWDPYDRTVTRSSRLQVTGELGALRLSRSHYAEALQLFLQAGYWPDAAYVAERVMTAEELRAYVDRHANPPPSSPEEAMRLRSLLARRLMRLGRWKDARPYYTPTEQARLDAYIAALRRGYDAGVPQKDRGLAIFAAARIMRKHGMGLAGTELGPDVTMYAGQTDFSQDQLQRRNKGVLAMSPDERQRLARPPEQLDRRFHYRYIAADHAWAAAQLLPDGSPELAGLLNEAGGWLKNRDPLTAQRFYDALVTRCPNTAIGKKAVQHKWFVSAD